MATPAPRPDWNQTDPKKADFILNKPSVLSGKDNVLLSESVAAFGDGNTVGLLGFYWTNIDFATNTITLSTKQGEEVWGDDNAVTWVAGDVISIANKTHYDYCSTITAVNGNKITVDSLPFTAIAKPDVTAIDDYGIFVPDKPTEGVVDFGRQSAAIGLGNTVSNWGSVAVGAGNVVQGQFSFASGKNNVLRGYNGHAVGVGNTQEGTGFYSHLEGVSNTVSGSCSHAEGGGTVASGNYSHTEGYKTKAIGVQSHAEGRETEASGEASHVEGIGSVASGLASHAEGNSAKASGNYSHAEGVGTEAKGERSHAEGNYTKATGKYSHVEGSNTEAGGDISHAEGRETKASGLESHAEGYATVASGQWSHAEGKETIASSNHCHAEGFKTTASGDTSHAEGSGTTASGNSSHAQNSGTKASGERSHAEGYITESAGVASHAEGRGSKAIGYASHAEGRDTEAQGDNSHAGGQGTIASRKNQTVVGQYNKEDSNALFIVGSGSSDDARENAFAVYADGTATLGGENALINPPMKVGVEYRTTERWKGYPVYVKCVKTGTLPNATVKTAVFSSNVNDVGIRVTGEAVSTTTHITLPVGSEGKAAIGLYCSGRNIAIDSAADSTEYTDSYCTVWYARLG